MRYAGGETATMKTPKRTIKFLERKEVEQIINAIKPEGSRNLRDKALLEVLFSTGMRISEALALTWIEFENYSGMGTMELPIIG